MSNPIKSALLIIAAVGIQASARGFLPYGGTVGTSHYAIEPVVSGFSATESAVVSHGSLPAQSTYTSGILAIANDAIIIKAALTPDGRNITVTGVADGCVFELFSTEGRRAMTGTVADGRIPVATLAAGVYILRLQPESGIPAVFNLLKR